MALEPRPRLQELDGNRMHIITYLSSLFSAIRNGEPTTLGFDRKERLAAGHPPKASLQYSVDDLLVEILEDVMGKLDIKPKRNEINHTKTCDMALNSAREYGHAILFNFSGSPLRIPRPLAKPSPKTLMGLERYIALEAQADPELANVFLNIDLGRFAQLDNKTILRHIEFLNETKPGIVHAISPEIVPVETGEIAPSILHDFDIAQQAGIEHVHFWAKKDMKHVQFDLLNLVSAAEDHGLAPVVDLRPYNVLPVAA